VYVISTGGTFEKSWDPIKEQFAFQQGSIVEHLLRISYYGSEPRVNVLRLVDSLHMSHEDRAAINKAIEDCKHDRIVIVHGTSKMVDTAEELKRTFPDKTIVLTGALKPYRYDATEAAFNLGGAMIAAQTLPVGTYIVIHGKVIPGELAEKNPQTGQFSKRKNCPKRSERKSSSKRKTSD
jgi:L-asparaginase